MKKYKLIYNPMSGNKKFALELDTCLQKFADAGIDLHIFRTSGKNSIFEHMEHIHNQYYDAILVAGGDGTVNEVINCIKKLNMDIPLGIFPAGTANDFSKYIEMPMTVAECCDIIIEGTTINVDLGIVRTTAQTGITASDSQRTHMHLNDSVYFLNVCGGGLLTNISQNINTEYKNLLGKLAYYLKGIEQINSNMPPLKLSIQTTDATYEEELIFFIILNSGNVAGFADVSPEARICDGLFEFIGIRQGKIHDLAALLFKAIRGDHLINKQVLYFRDSKISLQLTEPLPEFEELDIDGEAGPLLPVEVSVEGGALKIFCSSSFYA